MGVYDSQIAAAKRLIAAKGEACKWVKMPTAAAGGDAWNPQPSGDSPQEFDVSMAFFSPRDIGRGGKEYVEPVAGTEVSASVQVGLMGAVTGFTPNTNDSVLRLDGTKLSILKIDIVAPNSQPILYYVTVTR